MCQNVCGSCSEQQCQSYLYKNCTSCFYECRTSPVIRAFEQYVELSFCLWNIPDCEALRESCDILNLCALHEFRVSFPRFPGSRFLYQNVFANRFVFYIRSYSVCNAGNHSCSGDGEFDFTDKINENVEIAIQDFLWFVPEYKAVHSVRKSPFDGCFLFISGILLKLLYVG